MYLVIVRHAERLDDLIGTPEHIESPPQYEYDCLLSKKGHTQAFRTGQHLKHLNIQGIKVFSSPYQRCI